MNFLEIFVVLSSIFSFGVANTVISIKENEKAVLVCPTDFKSEQRVRWTRSDGKSMPLNTHIEGLNLILTNVTKDCSGSYRCDTVNAITTTYATQLTLEVKFPPKVTIKSYSHEHHAGSSSWINEEIVCVIEAFPKANSKFFINGQELNDNNSYGFTVADVPSTDECVKEVKLLFPRGVKFQGIIQCQGANTLGMANAETKFANWKHWQIWSIAVSVLLIAVFIGVGICCRSRIRSFCAKDDSNA